MKIVGRITRNLKGIDVLIIQRMIESVPNKMRKIEDNGPIAAM